MKKDINMTFQQRSLLQQGYQCYSASELKQLEWGLRFTPAVCATIALVGLVYQLPGLLMLVSALGIWAFFFPGKHPMDLIYNHGVRHLFGAVKLPENPFQRRLACLAAGIMSAAIAGLFLAGMPIAALVVGVMLLSLQAIVITTHFCTLSWMVEGLMRAMGKWKKPVDLKLARDMMDDGAVLVDVRSPSEFARDGLQEAVNLPLETLEDCLDSIRDNTLLLFCNSGARSQMAADKLVAAGVGNVFNVGAFGRAKTLVESAD